MTADIVDTLDGMRVFARVAQAGSFSAAARALGISKALASKYVSQLERRLGVRLLQRTTRAVTLTEAGREALDRCVVILGQLEDLENEAASARSAVCGTLRIAGPPVFGEDVLAGAVASFLVKNPAIRVELLLEERFVDLVGEGFDLAIRVGTLHDSTLVARRIGDHPFVFCASPAYLARKGTPARPADLAEHDCIVDVGVSPTAQWQFGVAAPAATRLTSRSRSKFGVAAPAATRLTGEGGTRVALRPRVRLNSGRAVATLVRAGTGIGLVALSFVREDLASGRLVRLFADCDAYDRSVYAVYPHRAHLPARVSAFVAHLIAELRAAAPSAAQRTRRARR